MINHLCINILNEILINYLFVKNVSRLLVKLVPSVYLYINYFGTSSAILAKRKWALVIRTAEQQSFKEGIQQLRPRIYGGEWKGHPSI